LRFIIDYFLLILIILFMMSHTTSKTLSGSQNYESLRTIHRVNQQIKEFLKEEKNHTLFNYKLFREYQI
jgi:hypothetical protein